MKLIFNGDDFGLSQGVNLGILEAYKNGPVRSTTLMAGGAGFEHAVEIAKANPGLKVGVHLTLSGKGKPLGSGYKTIVDEAGGYLTYDEMNRKTKAGEIDLGEVETEYELQIGKILKAGIVPDHFDSHHHSHHMPGLIDVFAKMVQKYEVKAVRIYDKSLLTDRGVDVKAPDRFEDGFYGDKLSFERLEKLITSFQGESLELMLHPAYIDLNLYQNTSYCMPRMYELDILTDEKLREFLKAEKYEICSFSDL